MPLVLGASLGAGLAAQDIGFPGPSLAGCGPKVGNPSPTASKPENKLWHNDGSWWGSLWSADAQAFHIHRLERLSHTWVDTGVEVESRPDSHSDALWDGTKLYIATHEFGSGPGTPGEPLLVLRYGYAAGTYSLDPGFPVVIGSSTTETMGIEKDSTGRLWAVWKQSLRVYYSYTLGSDELWSAPAVLPSFTSDFDADDICAIVRFSPNRIGVMWSDKVRQSFLFARHFDTSPPTTWQPAEVALNQWDDHIDLAADSIGRVFAVIKNSAEEVKLLVRGAGGAGGWQQHLVGDRFAELTRPILLLNESARIVHVFAMSASTINEKTSSLDTIAFAPGQGRIVIRDAGSAVNNPTSTRQGVDAATGVVVLAANESTAGSYWHHEAPGRKGADLVLAAAAPAMGGQVTVLSVTGASPGGWVLFYADHARGSGAAPPASREPGLELGPTLRRLGGARADARGVARLSLPASAASAGAALHYQAVEPASRRASARISRGP